MKVMAVLGSPIKDGNSGILAQKFLDKAVAAGAATSSFFLEGMNYKGCKACGGCKSGSDKCVIKDDLAEVLDEMHKSDIIVYATPNYFGDVSGQFKLFLDRTFSLLTPSFMSGPKKSRLAMGKKLVFILSQGAPEQAFTDILTRYAHLRDYFEFAEFHPIHAGNLMENGAVKNRPELLAKVEKLAEQLTKS
ncbi:MAG: flavodoxin family protein [Candidatus Riflebacteria bacterium]|nr:flavodoxin family protein [Candidatus Riflebacteria bacterium]